MLVKRVGTAGQNNGIELRPWQYHPYPQEKAPAGKRGAVLMGTISVA